jgi:hypothetical protein
VTNDQTNDEVNLRRAANMMSDAKIIMRMLRPLQPHLCCHYAREAIRGSLTAVYQSRMKRRIMRRAVSGRVWPAALEFVKPKYIRTTFGAWRKGPPFWLVLHNGRTHTTISSKRPIIRVWPSKHSPSKNYTCKIQT